MAKIGIAVIGTKGMGRGHIRAVRDTPGFELRAICDAAPDEAHACSEEFGVPGYLNHRDMLDADRKIKAATICTPHWFHPDIAVDCAKRKVHVLTEKPMAVTVRGADRMIAAHKKARTILAVVFQNRFSGANAKARRLVASGRVGTIHRVLMTTIWFRTQAYYDSGDWRGTWAGEGGGVLVNQATHDLDLMQWITGMMPVEVTAVCETAAHKIAVEDRASSLLRYANGATGYFHASTTELPGHRRLEIAGDRGVLLLEGDTLQLCRLKKPLSASFAGGAVWGKGEVEWRDVAPLKPKLSGHLAQIRDFHRAIAGRRKPAVPGEDGRNSLELANAMQISSFTGKPAKLPVSRAAYERLMADRIAQESRPPSRDRRKKKR